MLNDAGQDSANDYAPTEERPVIRRRPNRVSETHQASGCLAGDNRRHRSERLAAVQVAQPVSFSKIDAAVLHFDYISSFEQQSYVPIVQFRNGGFDKRGEGRKRNRVVFQDQSCGR
jgi:hypothetical protein